MTLPPPRYPAARIGMPQQQAYTADEVLAAILAERDRCAKMCDANALIDSPTPYESAAIRKCAAAIRSAE